MFGSEVDFAPIVEGLLGLVGAALSALAFWIGSVIRTRFKFAADLDAGKILDGAILKGIDYARKTIIGADGKMTLPVSNAIVAIAARYVADKLPETLQHFGLTEERLRDMILARLDAVVDIPEYGQPQGDYHVPNNPAG